MHVESRPVWAKQLYWRQQMRLVRRRLVGRGDEEERVVEAEAECEEDLAARETWRR